MEPGAHLLGVNVPPGLTATRLTLGEMLLVSVRRRLELKRARTIRKRLEVAQS
jgi:hypothetical protein